MAHALILFHGKAGSGKSSNSELTHDYLVSRGYAVKNLRFAQPVYELHDMIQMYMGQFGYGVAKKNRPLLQKVGTEIGRDVYGKDVWVNITMRAAKQFLDMHSPDEPAAVIIDDLRFHEEFKGADQLARAGLEVIRITLQAPEDVRRKRADMFPEDPDHRSEISLDDYVSQNKFDLRVDTIHGMRDDFSKIVEHLQSRLDRKKELQHHVSDIVGRFNQELEKLAVGSRIGANFNWYYNEAGVKQLRISDVADIVPLKQEELEKAKREVPSMIEQAGELVAQPT